MEKSLHLNKRTSNVSCLLAAALLLFAACKKYITVDTPSTSIDIDVAFKTNTGAAQVFAGIYSEISGSIDHGGLISTCVLPELSADNLTLHDPDGSTYYVDYFRNSLEPSYITSNEQVTYWIKSYRLLFTINMAIEKLTGNGKLTSSVRNRLLGEAYFLRAFVYFYLINFYGEVPLVLKTDYKDNTALKKNTSAEVYVQMLSDLSVADTLLDYNYLNGDLSQNTTNRLRPNLAAVQTLQARIHLYQKNYSLAEVAATKVIDHAGYELSSPDDTFLKNSTETIWGLQPVEIGLNTRLAILFLISDTGPNAWEFPVYASKSLVNSFEPGDARKEKWLGVLNVDGVNYHYINKYKRGFVADSKEIDEYTIAIRSAELYLIRAEARNEQGNSNGAVQDLNSIRNRSRGPETADVPNPLPELSTSLTQEELRTIILNERRVELFTEWGHRWFDLRRSGTINQVMTEEEKIKGGIWMPYKALYPVPQTERNTNPNLTQTPGYTN